MRSSLPHEKRPKSLRRECHWNLDDLWLGERTGDHASVVMAEGITSALAELDEASFRKHFV